MSSIRFICDEMLHGLGRWLRAAGYDTLIALPGTPDRDLITLALRCDRCLLSRDRKLMEMRHARKVALLLEANELDDCVRELSRRLKIDWQRAPFSRCLVCNTPLEPADQKRRLRAPFNIYQSGEEILYCPTCDKIFWFGSHVARMRRKLASFTDLTQDNH